MDQGNAWKDDSVDEPRKMGTAFPACDLRRGYDQYSVCDQERPNL